MDSRRNSCKTFIWKSVLLWHAVFASGLSQVLRGFHSSSRVPAGTVRRTPFFVSVLLLGHVVDAEFERVDDKTPPKEYSDAISPSKSLFDISLEADSDLNATRIPFFYRDTYIDAKLAFLADLDGETYGIGIPFEHAAAVTVEKADGSVEYLSPENDENEEIFQIFATQLREHVGDDLRLKRTPRILTISGPLERYTENWREELAPKAVKKDVLLDDKDEDLEFFHNFMREELGDEEYQKTLMDESTDDISQEILNFFDIPGLGDQKDDIEGMKQLFQSTLSPMDEQMAAMKEFVELPDHEGVALKLVSYIFRDGKSYSLVNVLKPYVLIGKCLREAKDDVRFELLSPEEEKLLIPRLEDVCIKDLDRAGLKLDR